MLFKQLKQQLNINSNGHKKRYFKTPQKVHKKTFLIPKLTF